LPKTYALAAERTLLARAAARKEADRVRVSSPDP
jgi:hypothetical protein